MYLGYVFCVMNFYGRVLFMLVYWVMVGYDEDDYVIIDGEWVCSIVVGWNFGDGYLYNE